MAYASLDDIDWTAWQPRQRATLLYVLCDGQILLIRKKRGLGAGKINGPGGRIEAGESAVECAVRETDEEVGIRARGVEERGYMRFQFVDGFSMQVDILTADAYEGTPCETDEAAPLWFPIDDIPYGEMWATDRHWLPEIVAGKSLVGRALFDGDEPLDWDIQTVE
ncbi:MAG: 8-oxo-dGTP diphosphatase [Candidatus Latescibacterota bacterium]|nr:8-oxo-dGTP diphosphatase [Candidatus Latescibacterota bacterium]